MRTLPSGTVTLLFTDIEGSTRLAQALDQRRFNDGLVEHRQILREAFAEHGGVELRTEGDSFFAAFASAREAVAAALQAQDALAAGPLPVRIGIHTGEPLPVEHEDGYVGVDVHRAARLMSAGHGGQVLLSQATCDLLDQSIELRDLGEHRLKDLAEPIRIFQLGDEEFPPLKSLNQTNLPLQLTPFVGRERELSELLALLRTHRLVTLTGAGGSGKTRLGLQAAAELVEEFADGVWFVSLAALHDPALVAPTIAQTLGVKEPQTAFEYLRNREALLLLDNFEQLLGSAVILADLLQQAPHTKALVTSRTCLRIAGEQEYPVPPLVDEEAVALFVERARAAKPSFRPDEYVPAICGRIDNLPLAIELAAARTRALTPQALLARLEQRLPLLSGRARDAPERQRTLRATIEWSHDLLDEKEKTLFARLAVFSGSFDAEAAEVVCEAELDAVERLIEKSLVQQTEDGRIYLFETIREFAAERLNRRDQSGELEARHARYFVDFVERAGTALTGGDPMDWLNRLALDYPNIRAALVWTRDSHENELHAQMVAGLGRFWYEEGLVSEGSEWLTLVFARTEQQGALRARLLTGATYMAALRGDWAETAILADERLRLYRGLGDTRGIAEALNDLGIAAVDEEKYERAREFLEQSQEIAREAGDDWMLATCMLNLGDLALNQGDFEEAVVVSERAALFARRVRDQHGCSLAFLNAGLGLLHRGDLDEAQKRLAESLRLSRDHGFQGFVPAGLEGLAAIAASRGDNEHAARLLGRADAFREESDLELPPFESRLHERTVGALVHELGSIAFDEARTSGTDMDLDEAIGAGRRSTAHAAINRSSQRNC